MAYNIFSFANEARFTFHGSGSMSVAVRMIEAVKAGDADGLRGILQGDAEAASARDEGGDSPLMMALYHGRRDLAELMLAHGRQPDPFEAAALGDADRLRAALDAEPGLVTKFAHDGWTLLHLAGFFGHLEAVRLLLERGADAGVFSINAMRNTPLHAALAGPLPAEGVRLLVDAGADVNARQHGGFTALHSAAQSGKTEIIDLLLDRGASLDAATEDGRRPLDFARDDRVKDQLRARGAADATSAD
jgi:ankyrin repeat protein